MFLSRHADDVDLVFFNDINGFTSSNTWSRWLVNGFAVLSQKPTIQHLNAFCGFVGSNRIDLSFVIPQLFHYLPSSSFEFVHHPSIDHHVIINRTKVTDRFTRRCERNDL